MSNPDRVPTVVDLLTTIYGRQSIEMEPPLHFLPVSGVLTPPTTGGIFYVKASDNTLRFLTSSGETVIATPDGNPVWGGISGTLSDQEDLMAALVAKAPLASPTFTGTVAASAITVGGNAVATQLYVDAKVAALVNSSPAALDTLKEFADALGNDANFATTTAAALGNRLRFDVAQSLSSDQKNQALANLGAGAGGKAIFSAADLAAVRSSIIASVSGATFDTATGALVITGGGGGGAIAIEAAAWIELSSGNDSTGEVGNPAKPFASVQAAYDAGARSFYFGAGQWTGAEGTLTINADSEGGEVNLAICGQGRHRTLLSTILVQNLTINPVKIQDIGGHSIFMDVITLRGKNGAELENGFGMGQVYFNNFVAEAVNVFAGDGGTGLSVMQGLEGGVLENLITIKDCEIATLAIYGGKGGQTGENDYSAGNGGNINSEVHCYDSRIDTVVFSGGGGGDAYGEGASPGQGGSVNGHLKMFRCLLSQIDQYPGVGGNTLGGPGPLGIAFGFLTLTDCVVQSVIQLGYEANDLNIVVIKGYVEDMDYDPALMNAYLSYVRGTYYTGA